MMIHKAGLTLLWLLTTAYVVGGTTVWTVTVVDTEANPVSGAEVAVCEYEYNFRTTAPTVKLLCPIQKTDARGQVDLSFTFENETSVMIVARNAGRAMGWDTLPYMDTALPRVHIVLEMPVPLPGRILDHEGNPVANACVQAIPKTSVLQRLTQRPVYGPVDWMEVRTDAEGRFLLNCFTADVSADFHITPAEGETTFILSPHNLTSCGFETGREEVTLTLPKPAVLKGKVIDDRGKGIAGLTIVSRIDHRDEMNYVRNNYVSYNTVTDREGTFCFRDIPACSHLLSIINNDTARPWAGKTVIVDAADEAAGSIAVQLEIGGMLTVTASDERTRQPVQNAYVSFWRPPQNDQEWYYNNGGYTDAEGKAIVVLPAGKCDSASQAKGYFYSNVYELPLIEKEKMSHVSIEMTPNIAVSGVVRNADGRPVRGAIAALTWGQKVLTGSDGAFRCVYTDRSFREGMCLIARHLESHQAAVQVIENPDEPMTLVLQTARRLVGTVLDVNGHPVPAARVELKFNGPGYLSDFGEEILTDKQGGFSFDAIPAELPAGYALRISVSVAGYGPQTYKRLVILQETESLITLEPIVLKPADRNVSGTVINQDGSPAVFLPVMASGDGQPRRTTVTDEKGDFVIRRVCDGSLYLQAGIGIGGEDFIPGRMTAQGGDTAITIRMGQQREHIPEPPSFDRSLIDWQAIGAAPDVPVLLCFFDYRQRPSRHTVGELANMTQLTADKKIQVVLVHIPDIEDEEFKRWQTGRNIPLRTIGFSGTFEGRPAQWGVNFLPWFILTDAERTVVAEGFELSELPEKLDGL